MTLQDQMSFTVDQAGCPACRIAADQADWPHSMCLFHLGAIATEAEIHAAMTAATGRGTP